MGKINPEDFLLAEANIYFLVDKIKALKDIYWEVFDCERNTEKATELFYIEKKGRRGAVPREEAHALLSGELGRRKRKFVGAVEEFLEELPDSLCSTERLRQAIERKGE
jgi:hypothetical protein